MHAFYHPELQTIRDLLRYAVSQFNAAKLSFGHGSLTAWDEAVYLLLHNLNLPLDTLEPFLDAKVLASERATFLELIRKRCTDRIPAAYLTGEAWLQGHRFVVDERVIIPRSPISELLTDQLSPWVANTYSIENVLDLCTGSGCLAILAALAFENAQVDAVDISENALQVTAQNISLYQLEQRVAAIQSNLFGNLQDRKYDLIISNPPYVNSQSMSALPAEYLHEPELALAGGTDGMDIIKNIIGNAASHLKPNGLLVLEIGNEYDNFNQAFPNLSPLWLSTEATENQILLLTKEQLKQ